jgi:carbon monoxide dehydrogenase subunit G
MQIEDSFNMDAPLALVWSVIRDPEKVAACLPGCSSVEAIDPAHYRAVVQVALGPIKTSFNLSVEVVEERPPFFAATLTKGEEGGRASSLTARNELHLEPVGETQTLVRYTSEVTLVGRLGNYGLGLMKKKAQSMGKEFSENLQTRLNEEKAAAAIASTAS